MICLINKLIMENGISNKYDKIGKNLNIKLKL